MVVFSVVVVKVVFCRTRLYYITVLNFKRLKIKSKVIKIITGEKINFLLYHKYNEIVSWKEKRSQ